VHFPTLAIGIFGLLFASHADAQITVTRGSNLSVDVARDGRLAIDLRGDIWTVAAGGGDARQLTHGLKSVHRPRWSPDGERLVCRAVADGQRGLWIVRSDDGEMRKLDTNTDLDRYPAWHPGGERIVYSSDIDGKGVDLWEIDLPTGLRWRLSDRAGDDTEAAWSADGRDLVYVNHNDRQWSLVLRRHSEPEEILLRSPDKLGAPAWRPDKSLISFFRSGAGGISLEIAILARPRLIRLFATNAQLVVSPVNWLDRQHMVYSANGRIRQRLFDSWNSRLLPFRAVILPEAQVAIRRQRPALSWPGEPAGKLVIHASRLFDGVVSGYRRNKDILIEGSRIASVEEHKDRPGLIVIDLGDLAILPGLIDADARLPSRLAPSHGPRLLTMGVTTVVASHPDAERLASLWSGKDVPGPRLLSGEQWRIGLTPRPELDVTAAVTTSRSTGRSTGEALPAQIRSLRTAALTPEQTLRGMGVNAAAALMADPYLGRIDRGAAADLIFVAGDPLANIDDVLNVVAVVRNGRFYSVSGLIDRAKRAESVE